MPSIRHGLHSGNFSSTYYLQTTAASVTATWDWGGGSHANAVAQMIQFLPSAVAAVAENVQFVVSLP